MNNRKSEIVGFLAQEAEKNIKEMLEHGLFREAGISRADVIAAIVCKPGYDTVKNRVIADIEPGVYGGRLLMMFCSEDVIYRAEQVFNVHFDDDGAEQALRYIHKSFGDRAIMWDWIDAAVGTVLDNTKPKAEQTAGGSHE